MNTFTKAERIVSQKLIDSMFTKGGQSHSLTAYPLRAVYLLTDNADAALPPVQLLLSVSKRRFKHAVDRSRRLAVALIWLADSLQPSADVERRLCTLLRRIAERLQPTDKATAPAEGGESLPTPIS